MNIAIQEAVKSAVADATNAVTLAQHMAQCEKDKGEMKADQLRMHNENREKFGTLEAQLTKVMRGVWMAAGAISVLHLALSEGGAAALHHVFGGPAG